MSTAAPAAFSRGGALALIAAGFALFLGLLYLIGAGENFGGERGKGQAHAASVGLNGYAGFARLIASQGYELEISRSPRGLETPGVLVLTPASYTDAEEIAKILEKRAFAGPTLVIIPKWWAQPPGPQTPPEVRAKFKRGWVTLDSAALADWTADLPAPYGFKHRLTSAGEGARPGWAGLGGKGRLPTATTLYALPDHPHSALITDAGGRILAFAVSPGGNDPMGRVPQPVYILAEPDLVNNYGLADPARAAAAVALIDRLAASDELGSVTFDMTLAGFGASENLLTLAFRPPFLAATLCLLAALLVIGWRAFQRFGPAAAAAGPDIAFGKRQLVTNGAGLIVRARRFALLRAPYAALSARRIAERLGLARPDPQAIDAALARRLPGEEPFTRRTARLEAATRPAEILAAAQALDALNTRLNQDR